MKVYKKILLFFMIVLLAISSISILTNAESIKSYDTDYTWGSSSWEALYDVDDTMVYKPIVFDEEDFENAQYLSISIKNIPEDLKDFEGMAVVIQYSEYGYADTYILFTDIVEEGKYYTGQIEYLEDIDYNIVLGFLYYYHLTEDDLIALNAITVDIWKWYSEPDYDLLLLLEDKGDYQGDYQEGYQEGFIAGEKSKIAKNNESFYNRIAIWIPAVITIVALTSIISIFGIKKKE